MLQARKDWADDGERGEVVAFPRSVPEAPRAFGNRKKREPLNLIVDLHAEEIGPRWFRGAATLAVLCGTAFFLAPDFRPFIGSTVAATPTETLHNASLSELAALGTPKNAIPKPVGVLAGEREGVQRTNGDVAGGLYWSLRGAGASPAIAAEYLKAIATRIDVGEVAPFDRFDFAVAKGVGGDPDRLIYAGIDRAMYSDVQVLKWTANGKTDWFDGNPQEQAANGLMAPVAGRITSSFGYRVHPILRFGRFHDGVDYGAAWGSPVFAAADGVVTRAGWSGGYGRQVRLAHPDGVVTSYAHLSRILAAPGTRVQRGQLIGLVGSSGFSTGAHLHFEVRRAGRPVDPMTFRPAGVERISATDLAALRARLEQLRSI